MIQPDIESTTIVSSIERAAKLYGYVKGERVFPLQDALMEQRYVDSIGRYFEYCQRVVTDPDVVALIQKSNVGRKNSEVLLERLPGMHILSAHGASGRIALLVEDASTRLVLAEDEEFDLTDTNRMGLWKNQLPERYPSKEADEWRVTEAHLDQGRYLYGYRNMHQSDMFLPDMLHDFVEGVSVTFLSLSAVAKNEIASFYQGLDNKAGIEEIITAFEQANTVLEGVFNPNPDIKPPLSPVKAPVTRRRGRPPKITEG